MKILGRLLFMGYGLAALVAGATVAAGASLALSALVFWIGGAVTVSALAMFSAGRMPPEDLAASVEEKNAEDALLAEALAAWERDRLEDRRAGTQRRDTA